jgi:transcriptional regulator with XRE-family HTH domain
VQSSEFRAARLALGLTQQAFGVAVGLSEKNAGRQVRRWESGEDIPRGTTIKSIEALLERRGLALRALAGDE